MLILVIPILLFSCQEKDSCGNNIEVSGLYENKFEEGAVNYLALNPDNTFEQHYRKGDAVKKHTGYWKYDKDRCWLKFDTLKVLHQVPYNDENSKRIPKMGPVFRNNKIMFYEDLPQEYDFRKISDRAEIPMRD